MFLFLLPGNQGETNILGLVWLQGIAFSLSEGTAGQLAPRLAHLAIWWSIGGMDPGLSTAFPGENCPLVDTSEKKSSPRSLSLARQGAGDAVCYASAYDLRQSTPLR